MVKEGTSPRFLKLQPADPALRVSRPLNGKIIKMTALESERPKDPAVETSPREPDF